VEVIAFEVAVWNSKLVEAGGQFRARHLVDRLALVVGGPEGEGAGRTDEVIAFGQGVEVAEQGAGPGGDLKRLEDGHGECFVGAEEKGNTLMWEKRGDAIHRLAIEFKGVEVSTVEMAGVITTTDMDSDEDIGFGPGGVRLFLHLACQFGIRGKSLADALRRREGDLGEIKIETDDANKRERTATNAGDERRITRRELSRVFPGDIDHKISPERQAHHGFSYGADRKSEEAIRPLDPARAAGGGEEMSVFVDNKIEAGLVGILGQGKAVGRMKNPITQLASKVRNDNHAQKELRLKK
jgi:hypothetical protein